MTNLLANAIKFTESGSVTVEIVTRAGRLEVTVADTGIGIAQEAIPCLFKPFSQVARPGGRLYEGTGLGLAIARNLARALGGDLTVESIAGHGSRFKLWLPLQATASGIAITTPSSGRAATTRRPRKRDNARMSSERTPCSVNLFSNIWPLRGLDYHLTRWPGDEPAATFLLHGHGDCGATFQFMAEHMPARMTLVAPDWRGFGRTSWAPGGYWFPDYYADLDELLDQLVAGSPGGPGWAQHGRQYRAWSMQACGPSACGGSSVSRGSGCRARSRMRRRAVFATGWGSSRAERADRQVLPSRRRPGRRAAKRNYDCRLSAPRSSPRLVRTLAGRSCAASFRPGAQARQSGAVSDAKKLKPAGVKCARPSCT